MDAKTMRAALAAAVRVTVSTSLIGCGGQATSDAGGPVTPGPESGGEHSPAPAKERPRYMTSSGGAASGGSPSAAGAGGEAEPTGCEALQGCLEALQSLEFGEPLPNAAAERCCVALIMGLPALQSDPATQQCGFQLESEFLGSGPAHDSCCSYMGLWQQPACTPWGPPVPPALPPAALRAWEAAA
jgi:hypothetical protein